MAHGQFGYPSNQVEKLRKTCESTALRFMIQNKTYILKEREKKNIHLYLVSAISYILRVLKTKMDTKCIVKNAQLLLLP